MEVKNDSKARLESALISTIEKWAKQSTTAADVEALAAVAQALIKLWRD